MVPPPFFQPHRKLSNYKFIVLTNFLTTSIVGLPPQEPQRDFINRLTLTTYSNHFRPEKDTLSEQARQPSFLLPAE
jgi:hypothetical protein